MHDDIERVLFPEERIQARVRELGAAITERFRGHDLVMLALMKGGVLFLADLVRSIELPLEFEFARAASYGAGTVSSGHVALDLPDLEGMRGRSLLVVDDILDSGRTMQKVCNLLRGELEPPALETCVLLDKAARRAVELQADYVGFECADEFVVGYGLDFANRYRNLPYIGVLHPRLYDQVED